MYTGCTTTRCTRRPLGTSPPRTHNWPTDCRIAVGLRRGCARRWWWFGWTRRPTSLESMKTSLLYATDKNLCIIISKMKKFMIFMPLRREKLLLVYIVNKMRIVIPFFNIIQYYFHSFQFWQKWWDYTFLLIKYSISPNTDDVWVIINP